MRLVNSCIIAELILAEYNMFRLICGAVLLLSVPAHADEWREQDTYREVAFQALNVIDWGQTRYIAKHPETYYERESAWMIGEHPTTIDVNRLMIATAILHPVISYLLPHGWRDAFQYVTIIGKINNVAGNNSIGIKVEF